MLAVRSRCNGVVEAERCRPRGVGSPERKARRHGTSQAADRTGCERSEGTRPGQHPSRRRLRRQQATTRHQSQGPHTARSAATIRPQAHAAAPQAQAHCHRTATAEGGCGVWKEPRLQRNTSNSRTATDSRDKTASAHGRTRAPHGKKSTARPSTDPGLRRHTRQAAVLHATALNGHGNPPAGNRARTTRGNVSGDVQRTVTPLSHSLCRSTQPSQLLRILPVDEPHTHINRESTPLARA